MSDEDLEGVEHQPHEIDDGAVEVIEDRPSRGGIGDFEEDDIHVRDRGGKMAAMRIEAEDHLREFVVVRTPAYAAKVSLHHMKAFKALWKGWVCQRVENENEVGLTIREIAERMGQPHEALRTVIAALLRHRMIVSHSFYKGYGAKIARYRPTERGLEIYALAETIGPGCSIQVGGTPTAWKSRSNSEPASIFHHARLRGGRRNNGGVHG